MRLDDAILAKVRHGSAPSPARTCRDRREQPRGPSIVERGACFGDALTHVAASPRHLERERGAEHQRVPVRAARPFEASARARAFVAAYRRPEIVWGGIVRARHRAGPRTPSTIRCRANVEEVEDAGRVGSSHP